MNKNYDNSITFFADEYCDTPATSALDTFEGIPTTYEDVSVLELKTAIASAMINLHEALDELRTSDPQGKSFAATAVAAARRVLANAL